MDKQLTFESIDKARPSWMKDGPKPNITVGKNEEKRVGPQATEILSRLKSRPVRISEMSNIAKQYNARINEIRRHLSKIGMTVDCFESKDGDNEYRIVPLAGSNYQKKLMARQAQMSPVSPGRRETGQTR